MEQEYDGTRVLLMTEETDRLGDLKITLEKLGCWTQIVSNPTDLKLILSSQPIEIIFVDYPLALSQKFSISQVNHLQSKLWYIVVISHEQDCEEQFLRAGHLKWGFQDVIVGSGINANAHDVLRRWERRLEISKFDSKEVLRAGSDKGSLLYYKIFAEELSAFRQESLRLIADYQIQSLAQLAHGFKDRASEAGFSMMGEKIQKLQKAEGARIPLVLWKHLLDDCEQLERQISHFLQSTEAS